MSNHDQTIQLTCLSRCLQAHEEEAWLFAETDFAAHLAAQLLARAAVAPNAAVRQVKKVKRMGSKAKVSQAFCKSLQL